jgi:chemotaxis protein methyltransferase WspC
MELKIIEDLLKQKIGLDGNRVNSTHIPRAVAERMRVSGCTELSSYLRRLQIVPQELEELIEQVVVPETYFFRDREAFACMKNYVTSRWIPNKPDRVLRVLSLPCSTGEEPYSIAMTLLEAGLLPHQFRIDAIDISNKALSIAKQAIYTQNSFRGDCLEFRDRYFQAQGKLYHLKDWVSGLVNFQQGNLLNPLFPSGKSPYDFIWCRNLLIYFEPADQTRALQVLDQLLFPGGLFFLGYSETGLLQNEKFTNIPHPRAFAYQKLDLSQKTPTPAQSNKPPAQQSVRQSTAQRSAASSTHPTAQTAPPPPPFRAVQPIPEQFRRAPAPRATIPPQVDSLLDRAKGLANSGQLREALALCETFVRQYRGNPDGYILLAEVCEALGQTEQAEANYQKAIYLDPHNYKALFHLTQLKEAQGNMAAAQLFRERLQQIQPTSGVFR